MARAFDSGSSQSLSAATALGDTPITISSWVKPASSGNYAIFSLSDSSDTDRQHLLQIRASGVLSCATRFDSSLARSDSSGSVTNDEWNHCGGVWATTSLRTSYLDGVASTPNTTTLSNPGADDISIGRAGDSSPGNFMDGSVAELGVWDVALTDEEMLALSRGVRPDMVRPESLILYIPLVDATDQDIVGGVSFTANNSPTVDEHVRIMYPDSPQVPHIAATGGANTLNADTGSYVYAGTDAALIQARLLDAVSGSYIFTGTAAELVSGVQLAADSGAYVYTGTDAGLTAQRVLDADSGSFAFTGTAADLIFTPAGSFTLIADTGAYVYAGTDAAFLTARVLSADTGGYNYTGTDATLTFLPAGSLSTSCNLVDRNNTPLPNLTLISWAWFDHVDPINYIAPTDQGGAETTDGTGLIAVNLPNTTLISGQSGSLILRSNDGTLLGAYNLEVST